MGNTGVYHLNEILPGNVIKDSSPKNNHGIVIGSPVLYPHTMLGRMYFDAGSSIQLPNVPELHIGNGDFTVSGWMNLFNLVGDPAILGDKDWSRGSNTGYILAWKNNEIKVVIGYDNLLRATVKLPIRSIIPNYVNVVVDKDSDVKLYLNGNVDRQNLSQTLKNNDISPDNNIFIGSDGTGAYPHPFLGSFDEIRFANVARSTEWIATMYNNFVLNMFGRPMMEKHGDLFPYIALTGANPQTIELGTVYTELGATSIDKTDGFITASIRIANSTVNTSILGSYDVTYDVTNTKGNHVNQITRTVNVIDTIPPTFDVDGNSANYSTDLELGDIYNFGTIQNIVDKQSTTTSIIDASNINGTQPAVGTYSITYTVTEDAGSNLFKTITETVKVVDTTSPVITLTGVNPYTIELGDVYNEIGATTDDGTMIMIDKSALVDVVGSYRILYDATDASGNAAVQVIRRVNIVDTTPPTFVNGTMNMGTSILSLNFSESIDQNNINSIGMSVGITHSIDGFLNKQFDLLDSEMLLNAGPDNTVSYKLSEERRLLVRTVSNPDLAISISDNAVYDMNGIGFVDDSFTLDAIKDKIPPELVSANLNKMDGKIEMIFSESVFYGIIPDSSKFVSVEGAGGNVVKIVPVDLDRNVLDPIMGVTVTVQLTNDKRLEISELVEPLTITMEKESVTDLSINYIVKVTKSLTVNEFPKIPMRTDIPYDFENNNFVDLRLVSSNVFDTKISSVDIWNGNYFYPVFVPAPVVKDSFIEFKVGSDDVNLDLDHPVSLIFLGMGGDKPHLFSYYTSIGSQYTKIDTECTDVGFAVQFGDAKNSTCWEDNGTDYIIQTNHFTSFGLGFDYPDVVQQKRGGSGGGDKIPPSISVSFDEHEYPLEYEGAKYNHTSIDSIPTKTIGIGEELKVTLRVYENSGPSNVLHAEMYLNHHGTRVLNNLSETVIIHDKQKGLEIIDPHDIIDVANVTSYIQGNKAVFDFTVIPKDEMLQSDILFRVWDNSRNSMTLHLPDVLIVEISELPKNVTSPISESDISNKKPDSPPPRISKIDESSQLTDVQRSTLKKWAGYDVIISSDADVLYTFGISGDKIPTYVKLLVKHVLKDEISKEEFINMLEYLLVK